MIRCICENKENISTRREKMVQENICVYYDEKKEFIIDINPRELDPETKSVVEQVWNQDILRKILILISQGTNRLPDIQEKIGHSASTLHGAVQKLVHANLISYEMIYRGNKQKILSSKVICVTKNQKSKSALQKFFQGLWIDSKKTNRIIKQMQKDPKKWWTPEELSLQTKIPVDEIMLLLSNFDSQTTRSLSQLLKEPPFEKKIEYRAKPDSKEE